jgi:hypothetical protein
VALSKALIDAAVSISEASRLLAVTMISSSELPPVAAQTREATGENAINARNGAHRLVATFISSIPLLFIFYRTYISLSPNQSDFFNHRF